MNLDHFIPMFYLRYGNRETFCNNMFFPISYIRIKRTSLVIQGALGLLPNIDNYFPEVYEGDIVRVSIIPGTIYLITRGYNGKRVRLSDKTTISNIKNILEDILENPSDKLERIYED